VESMEEMARATDALARQSSPPANAGP
jgi:hypothetical protein